MTISYTTIHLGNKINPEWQHTLQTWIKDEMDQYDEIDMIYSKLLRKYKNEDQLKVSRFWFTVCMSHRLRPLSNNRLLDAMNTFIWHVSVLSTNLIDQNTTHRIAFQQTRQLINQHLRLVNQINANVNRYISLMSVPLSKSNTLKFVNNEIKFVEKAQKYIVKVQLIRLFGAYLSKHQGKICFFYFCLFWYESTDNICVYDQLQIVDTNLLKFFHTLRINETREFADISQLYHSVYLSKSPLLPTYDLHPVFRQLTQYDTIETWFEHCNYYRVPVRRMFRDQITQTAIKQLLLN